MNGSNEKSGEPVHGAAAFWDRELHQPTHNSWMENPEVRTYINGSLGGRWPLGWLQHEYPGIRFRRALSIGCGSGALERDLILRGLCDRVDAFDGSIVSIFAARASAKSEGMQDRLRYFVADFNFLRFMDVDVKYDCIFFHQSLHHVAKLERLFRRLLPILSKGGMLYLDEYFGPSRADWNERLIAELRTVYDDLPPDARLHDELPLPIQMDDPSEAIRSGEILTQLRIGFEIERMEGYGGNVISVLYPTTNWQAAPPSLLAKLINLDQQFARKDGPYYAIIVARPKRGVKRLLGWARYYFAPKWQILKEEMRRRFLRTPSAAPPRSSP